MLPMSASVSQSQAVDSTRLSRVHVITVRGRNDIYNVILSDGSEVLWEVWTNLTESERWGS